MKKYYAILILMLLFGSIYCGLYPVDRNVCEIIQTRYNSASSNNYEWRLTKRYDDNGNILDEIAVSARKGIQYIKKYLYDKDGRLIKYEKKGKEFNIYNCTYDFDINGRRVFDCYWFQDIGVKKTPAPLTISYLKYAYLYDDNGKHLGGKWFDVNGREIALHEISLNNFGKIVNEGVSNISLMDRNISSGDNDVDKIINIFKYNKSTKYTYDVKGHLTSSVTKMSIGKILVSSEEMEYIYQNDFISKTIEKQYGAYGARVVETENISGGLMRTKSFLIVSKSQSEMGSKIIESEAFYSNNYIIESKLYKMGNDGKGVQITRYQYSFNNNKQPIKIVNSTSENGEVLITEIVVFEYNSCRK